MHLIKHHIVYKTICLVTGCYYIGMHSTNEIDDGYLGSGIRLTKSIEKYGKENHTRIILEHCSSRDELKQKEAIIVNEDLLKDKLCLNIALGGGEGWDQINAKRSTDEWAAIQKLGYKAMVEIMTPEQRSARSINSWKNPTPERLAIARRSAAIARVAAATSEVNEKRKATLAEIKHQQGIKNSQYGKIWVTNKIDSKRIAKQQLNEYISLGYYPGRICLRKKHDNNSYSQGSLQQRQGSYSCGRE